MGAASVSNQIEVTRNIDAEALVQERNAHGCDQAHISVDAPTKCLPPARKETRDIRGGASTSGRKGTARVQILADNSEGQDFALYATHGRLGTKALTVQQCKPILAVPLSDIVNRLPAGGARINILRWGR